ncbi:hypothetical protein V8E53_000241 [Lactarius tabidus]
MILSSPSQKLIVSTLDPSKQQSHPRPDVHRQVHRAPTRRPALRSRDCLRATLGLLPLNLACLTLRAPCGERGHRSRCAYRTGTVPCAAGALHVELIRCLLSSSQLRRGCRGAAWCSDNTDKTSSCLPLMPCFWSRDCSPPVTLSALARGMIPVKSQAICLAIWGGGPAKEWRDKPRIPPCIQTRFWCSDELRRELRQAQELPRSTINWSEHSARVLQNRFIIRPEFPVTGAKPQIFVKRRAALDLSFE